MKLLEYVKEKAEVVSCLSTWQHTTTYSYIYIQPKLPFSTPPWHRELLPITNGYGLLGKFCVSRVCKAHLCNAENRPDSVPLVSILTAGRVNVKYKNNKNKNQKSLERNGKYAVNLPLEKRLFS